MGISIIRERLAAMSKQVKGVKTAKVRFPRTIQNAELPCMIVASGPAEYSRRKGEQTRVEERRFTLTLYVANVTDGIEAKAEEAAEAFLERIADYFDARPGLELGTQATPAAIVDDAQMMGDSGLRVIAYPEGSATKYMTVSFTLRVRQQFLVRYKD